MTPSRFCMHGVSKRAAYVIGLRKGYCAIWIFCATPRNLPNLRSYTSYIWLLENNNFYKSFPQHPIPIYCWVGLFYASLARFISFFDIFIEESIRNERIIHSNTYGNYARPGDISSSAEGVMCI